MLEVIGLIAAYLFVSAFCYWITYTIGFEYDTRLNPTRRPELSEWQRICTEQKIVAGIFVNDFLGRHCPWSWKRCVAYRVSDARLQLQFSIHKKGWTAADCDKPYLHDQIARDCYISRTRFWAKQVFYLITMPLRGLLVGLLLIGAIAALLLGGIRKIICPYGCG